MDTTPISLLERVRRPTDHEAWGRFVQLYAPLVVQWARGCRLQDEEVADLSQDVFLTLFQKLPDFSYDRHKSFRGWLRTVTLNRLRDRQRRAGTRALPGDDGDLENLADHNGAFDLEEADYRRQLVGRALKIMHADFQPATWQAFWEHGVLGRPADEVAAELGVTPAGVYGSKFRVLSRLRQELGDFLD